MTRLEFFESGLALIAFRLGLLSGSKLGLYDLYKTYSEFFDQTKNSTKARELTMIERNVEYYEVARSIYFFEDIEHRKRKPNLQNSANNLRTQSITFK